jgi:hypothetical protein
MSAEHLISLQVVLAQSLCAQNSDPQSAQAAVPMLPKPPVLELVFFESPLLLCGSLVVVAIIILVLGNRHGRLRPAGVAAAGMVIVAGVIFALAGAVETTREHLAGRTRALVDLVARADLSELSQQLDAKCQLRLGLSGPAMDRSSLLAAVGRYPGSEFPISEHSVLEVHAVIDGKNLARTQARLRLRTKSTLYDLPVTCWFRIDWRADLSPDGTPLEPWRVAGVTLVQLDGVGNPASVGSIR